MTAALALLVGVAWGQQPVGTEDVLPVPEGTVAPRHGPDKGAYKRLEAFQKLLEDERSGREADAAEIQALREQLRKAAEEATSPPPPADPTSGAGIELGEGGSLPLPGAERPGLPDGQPTQPTELSAVLRRGRPAVGDVVGGQTTGGAPGVQIFPVPEGAALPTRKYVLPTGSYVKVRIMTGVEAGDAELVPMMLQADYAATGPNGTRIDLTGCMMIAQVSGQLSTDRVVGKVIKLSCVRDDGRSLSVPVDGYLVGEDSTLGVVGSLISRQGRVMAAATVANLAKGAGDAVAAANTTTSIVAGPLGASGEVAKNVTGDAVAYSVGGAVSEAAEDIATWYLTYAQKLTPAIAVGSGRDVWVVLLDTVEFEGLR